MGDYTPRTKPLIPVGHRTWLAVSRVKEPSVGADATVDQRIEWLLEAITRPGADQSQRHDDLESLAELVIKTRGERVPVQRSTSGAVTAYTWSGSNNFGYGVAPIDSDTHDPDCVICGDSAGPHGHEPDFDRHPYTTKENA